MCGAVGKSLSLFLSLSRTGGMDPYLVLSSALVFLRRLDLFLATSQHERREEGMLLSPLLLVCMGEGGNVPPCMQIRGEGFTKK